MDNVFSRAEHEEFRKTLDAQFQRLNDEDKRQNRRIEELETTVKQVADLTRSVEKLAVNMENMLKVQEQQSKRLETLEGRDGEMWRKVVGYLATAIIGIVIGFVFTQLGM